MRHSQAGGSTRLESVVDTTAITPCVTIFGEVARTIDAPSTTGDDWLDRVNTKVAGPDWTLDSCLSHRGTFLLDLSACLLIISYIMFIRQFRIIFCYNVKVVRVSYSG